MKKYLVILLCLTGLFFNAGAQNSVAIDSGTFLLHKFEQHIGKETYRILKTDKGITYAIDFKFVDRGATVPLKAELRLTSSSEPLGLTIRGRTSRSSSINDDINIAGNEVHLRVDDSSYTEKLSPLTFPVAGYSPGTVQQVLLQYWKNHNPPASIKTLPFGAVQIKKDGNDTLNFNNKPLILDRYTIGGLIWGNELLWADHDGRLMCLITNDAEADKLEMMREPYEALLPVLISRAATYSMRLFTKAIPKPGAGDKIIAVVGGTIVDVVNDKTIPNSVVLIESGMIKRVGKAGQVIIPKGARIIDAKGKTVLPGLWDMHAHFEQAEWGRPTWLRA
jgi:hypothetical protein